MVKLNSLYVNLDRKEGTSEVLTAVRTGLIAEWLGQTGLLRMVPPQNVRNEPWRRVNSAQDILPQIKSRHEQSPWSSTDSTYSPLALNASIRNAEAWDLNHDSRLSGRKADSSRTEHIRTLPWRKTEMSTQQGKLLKKQSCDRSTLKLSTEPFKQHIRPRLQLQIPGQAGVSENLSASQVAIKPGQNDPVSLNAAANEFVPQQALDPANQVLPNIRNQAPLTQDPPAATRPSISTDLTAGLHNHPAHSTDEASLTVNRVAEQLPSQTTISGRALTMGQIPSSNFTSPPHSATLLPSAAIYSSISEGAAGGGQMRLHGLNAGARGPRPQYTTSISSPGQSEFIQETVTPRTPDTPRLLTVRQAHGHEHSHTAGRQRLQGHAREVTHTNSRTWHHPRTRLHAKWAEVHRNLKDMSLIKEGQQSPSVPYLFFSGSFCVPTTFNEWIEHRSEFANDRAKEARHQLFLAEEHRLRQRHHNLPPAGETAPILCLPFGGIKFQDGRGTVLAAHTIWTPWRFEKETPQVLEDERPEALWPCAEEMKEEGNERNTSQYRRFLALPRVPGNHTVNWKQKKILPMLPFDEIWKLPCSETYLEQRTVTSRMEMQVMETMIGKDLLAGMSYETENK